MWMIQAKRAAVLIVAALTFVAVQPAKASIIFQSVPDLTDTTQLTYPWCSTCSGSYRVFDQFSIGATESITGLTVGVYNYSQYWPATMNFSIWTVNGNVPDTKLFSQDIPSGDFTTLFSTSTYPYLAVVHTDDVAGLTLTAGTYYASFYNPSNMAIWGYQGGGGNLYQQGVGYYPGTSAGFILEGGVAAVPEPTSLLLLGTGLGGLALAAWRRRK